MSGYHIVDFQLLSTAEQLFKFEVAVTIYARIWSKAVFISIDERLNDALLEIVAEIEHKVRHSQLIGYVFGVLHVLQRAAGMLPRHAHVLVLKQLHRGAYAVKAALLHKACGNAGVHTAAHGNKRFHRIILSA